MHSVSVDHGTIRFCVFYLKYIYVAQCNQIYHVLKVIFIFNSFRKDLLFLITSCFYSGLLFFSPLLAHCTDQVRVACLPDDAFDLRKDVLCSWLYDFCNFQLLGPFYGAIAVPSVTCCRCRRCYCCVWQLAVANGPNIFQMLLAFYFWQSHKKFYKLCVNI